MTCVPGWQLALQARHHAKRRETVKTMLLAAATALSLGTIGSAYADGGERVVANTQFTQTPGVVAKGPVHNVPPVATAQNGQVAQSNNRTWIYPPIQNYLRQ
jgi:hypothetical protein